MPNKNDTKQKSSILFFIDILVLTKFLVLLIISIRFTLLKFFPFFYRFQFIDTKNIYMYCKIERRIKILVHKERYTFKILIANSFEH